MERSLVSLKVQEIYEDKVMESIDDNFVDKFTPFKAMSLNNSGVFHFIIKSTMKVNQVKNENGML